MALVVGQVSLVTSLEALFPLLIFKKEKKTQGASQAGGTELVFSLNYVTEGI